MPTNMTKPTSKPSSTQQNIQAWVQQQSKGGKGGKQSPKKANSPPHKHRRLEEGKESSKASETHKGDTGIMKSTVQTVAEGSLSIQPVTLPTQRTGLYQKVHEFNKNGDIFLLEDILEEGKHYGRMQALADKLGLSALNFSEKATKEALLETSTSKMKALLQDKLPRNRKTNGLTDGDLDLWTTIAVLASTPATCIPKNRKARVPKRRLMNRQ
jgi:hypothetical protein